MEELRRRVEIVDVGFTIEGRERDDILAAGVGVPAKEARGFSGGGPIEPSIRAFDIVDVDEARAFTRVLLANGALAAGVASFPLSLPESDMTDGGRVSPGVEKTLESRRWAIFDG